MTGETATAISAANGAVAAVNSGATATGEVAATTSGVRDAMETSAEIDAAGAIAETEMATSAAIDGAEATSGSSETHVPGDGLVVMAAADTNAVGTDTQTTAKLYHFPA